MTLPWLDEDGEECWGEPWDDSWPEDWPEEDYLNAEYGLFLRDLEDLD